MSCKTGARPWSARPAVASFRRIPQALPATDDFDSVTVTVDGAEIVLRRGDSVAAAVLLSGNDPYRRSVLNGEARALVEVDGVPNRQGCLVEARDGMRIVRQMGLRRIAGF